MTVKISPSGQLTVFVLGGLSVLSFLLSLNIAGGLFSVAFLIGVFVFRATPRNLTCCHTDMVAPIEGKIVDYSNYYVDSKHNRRWQRIDILRSSLGPWTLYSPLEGSIDDVWFQENPQQGCLELVVHLRSNVQEDFLLILLANRFLNYFDGTRLQPGSILGKGSDLGFCIQRRISICVPTNWSPRVGVDARIHARKDVLFHDIG